MRKTLLLTIIGVMFITCTFSLSTNYIAGVSPVITTTPGFTEFEAGKGAVTIDGGVTVSDADSDKASKAIVKLSNHPDGGNEFITIDPDVVDLARDYGLTVNYDFTNGELSITGEADLEVYQMILQKLTYNNVSVVPNSEDRIVIFTITDIDGNVSESKSRIIRIKNIQAVITNVLVSENDLYGIDQTIQVTFIFNKPVFVKDGTPSLPINVGGKEDKLYYDSGSGTNRLVFIYKVQEGDLDSDGVVITPEILLEGASIADNVEEAADLAISTFPDTSGILVDGIRPYVTKIVLPKDGVYAICGENKLVFHLVLSEAVSVSGGDFVLAITLDSGDVPAVFDLEASTETDLVFSYEIKGGDSEADGIEIKSLILNGTSILDEAGNALTDLTFTKTEDLVENNITIDATAPDVPVVTGVTPDSGSSVDDGITNTAALQISGTAEAGMSVKVLVNDDEVGEVTTNAEGNWSFDATSLDLKEGSFEITAKSVDGACNESDGSEPFGLIIDMTGPVLKGMDKVVKLGEDGTVTITPDRIIESVSDNFSTLSEIGLSLNNDTFTCDHVGENEVVITSTDLAGNETTTIVNVMVESDEAPEFVIQDVNLELGDEGTAELSYEDIVTGFSASCVTMDQFSFALSESSFGCSNIGDNLITLSISYPDGEVLKHDVTINVSDKLAPTVNGVEENIDIYVGESGEYVLEDYLDILEISDNCGLAMINQSPARGTVLSGYNEPFEIAIMAMDGSGNVTEFKFTITLKSNVIESVAEPEEISVKWGTSIEDVPLPDQVEVVTISGEKVMVNVNWDIQDYNSLEPNVYQNFGDLDLTGSEYTNPSELRPSVTIIVLEKELPTDILLSEDEFSVEDDPNAPLGILTTVDPDDDEHTYSLTGDHADEQYFYILGDRLFFDPAQMPDDQHEYTITISSTDRVGNVITKAFMITRTKPELNDLNIPNVFSPNGDGINDEWGIRALQFYDDVKLMVFERSGKMVFVTFDPKDRWDGRYEGIAMPVGSYYYVVELGGGQKRRGMLTLIRN
ncbi:gliding motility-associated C-terminal domain-containing protein [Echinicola sp. CAU 1574]|uniref:Gliding motility-associated C-terminal domain-containing protein n=1 Tax=Echinicola arenosa TaxID=2774144 RepID=A0ABR9AFW5_9BACT|nr:gliding motility-associated C-terminal domain-containing protein [Echinicola arenosa]MBD8487613.1 gliding motility-associated C-terminal domain-containing protein [Echinicola arenosa]